MVEYRRNPAALKHAIREHSIFGFPLEVPIFTSVSGISTSTIRGLTTVIVSVDRPVPFDSFADAQGLADARHDLKYWVQYAREHRYPHADTEPLRWMHPYSRAMLEDGYRISLRDIQKAWLRALGHLDEHDRVIKYSFSLNEVFMFPNRLERGMIVEFEDLKFPTARSIVGRVIERGVDPQDAQEIIYLEPFEPVPALLAPRSLAPWMLEPSFVSNLTWVLGYGTLEAMKQKRVKIPKGKFDPKDVDKRVYFLDKPMPMSVIDNFCKKNYPDSPECIWQSMTLLVLPLHPSRDPHGRHHGGVFRPYPDDVSTTEIEAQIDYIGEGMEFQ